LLPSLLAFSHSFFSYLYGSNFKFLSMKKLTIILLAAALTGCSGKENTPEVVISKSKYTVTFDLGNSNQTQSVDSGSVAQKPAAPTKADSCFLGWYTSSACTDTFDFATPITANITVYAGWSKRHTITFVLNGGTGVTKCYVCDSVALSLPDEPTKDGYSFVDWCIDSVFSAPFFPYELINIPPWQGESYFIPLRVTKDTTLYALWINGEKIHRNMDNNSRFYWCAYEDEPGLYTNQTTGNDTYNGRKNTGGEANDACRSRGAGWYLPALNEIYRPDSSGNYWTSSVSGYSYDNAAYYIRIKLSEVDYSYSWQSGSDLRTKQMRVRCVWRPLYEN
jgi:uncharacterized repeat protein (TIGR02543 family)